jgi:hypothetical protein
VRKGASTLLIAAGLLGVPSSAVGARVTFTGHIAGDTSTAITLTVLGNRTDKRKFIPVKVSSLRATVDFTCFDGAGNVVSTSKRSDLPFGQIPPAKVTKKGGFFSALIADGGSSTYQIKGRLRKGKASGELGAIQNPSFQPNGPHCSTGSFSNVRVTWTAKLSHLPVRAP